MKKLVPTFFLLFSCAAHAQQQMTDEKVREIMELMQAATSYGPICESWGHEKGSDSFFNCVVQQSVAARQQQQLEQQQLLQQQQQLLQQQQQQLLLQQQQQLLQQQRRQQQQLNAIRQQQEFERVQRESYIPPAQPQVFCQYNSVMKTTLCR